MQDRFRYIRTLLSQTAPSGTSTSHRVSHADRQSACFICGRDFPLALSLCRPESRAAALSRRLRLLIKGRGAQVRNRIETRGETLLPARADYWLRRLRRLRPDTGAWFSRNAEMKLPAHRSPDASAFPTRSSNSLCTHSMPAPEPFLLQESLPCR